MVKGRYVPNLYCLNDSNEIWEEDKWLLNYASDKRWNESTEVVSYSELLDYIDKRSVTTVLFRTKGY